MGLLRKVTVVGAAVSFARSEQGKKTIAEARRRVDTPANRERARQGVQQVTAQLKARRAAR